MKIRYIIKGVYADRAKRYRVWDTVLKDFYNQVEFYSDMSCYAYCASLNEGLNK